MKPAHGGSSPGALLPPAPNHPLTLVLAPTLAEIRNAKGWYLTVHLQAEPSWRGKV